MKKLVLGLLALVVILLVIFAVRLVGARDETDAVDADDAAAIVRGADDSADDEATPAADVGDRPEPGTYTYVGSGHDSVDVLGGSKHTFPRQIAVVVELDGDNRQEWTANAVFVKQHIENRRYRTTNAGTEDLGFTRKIEFFGQLQENDYTCEEGAERLRALEQPGATWTWTCTQEGDKATLEYRATFVDTAPFAIGGEQVEAFHVRVDSTHTGGSVGTDRSEFWYAKSGLPLRMKANLRTTTDSVLGSTNFVEQYDYTLTSLVPE